MKYKIASAIHLLVAVVSVSVMAYTFFKNVPLSGPVGYAIIFVLVPLISAYGLLKQKIWGVALSVLFFLPQCINYAGQSSAFHFLAPVSLGFTLKYGGTIFMFNAFAIGMLIFMFVLLSEKLKRP